MIILLSPAKALDYQTPPHLERATQPAFIEAAAELIKMLRTLSPAQIASLMRISDPLAQLNFQRYADWSAVTDKQHSKQAVLAFNGDVYEGLNARTLSAAALDWAQDRLRILSGLYGMLRPLDLIQPYRLEMATRLANARGRDLYAFWGERITEALNAQFAQLAGSGEEGDRRILINLASAEYFKSVQQTRLDAKVITPVFEDWQSGRYKIVSFYAKRARGLMARYAIANRIVEAAQLKDFNSAGYIFAAQASDETRWVFRRRIVNREQASC